MVLWLLKQPIVYDDIIDKNAKIDRDAIRNTIKEKGGIHEDDIEMTTNIAVENLRNEYIKNNPKTSQEAYNQAIKAGEFTYIQNQIFGTLLNSHLAGMFTKGPSIARNILSKPSHKLIGNAILEGAMEFGEEAGSNSYSEHLGENIGKKNYNYNLSEFLKNDAFTQENIEGGIIGMIMGSGQSSITSAASYKQDKEDYKNQQEILKEYKKYKNDPNLKISDSKNKINCSSVLHFGSLRFSNGV